MRKSSKARLFSTCLTGAILAAASPAWGQTSDAPTWKPRAEVDAQVGKDIGLSTSLFAPIAQNDSSLVYVDGRIGYDQRFDRNGSATVGARFRTGEDTAIGVNVGADFYRSDIGSRDQAAVSMGLEGFSSVFDVRVNYRLPLSKTRTIGYIDPNAAGTSALVLEGNRLIERRSGFRLEAIPLQGFNGEAGVRLPVGDNASIRGSVGGFDYWDKDADQSYRGYRVGLEMDIEDKDSGARFTFGGTLEDDNRYGTDARATVRLSIPFGGRASDRGAVPTGLDRQMGDRVRRDYHARSGSRYTDLTTNRFAIDARTGNQFGGFYYTSGTGVLGAAGTLAAPTTIADAVSRAGTNGVVVALGSGGNITTPGVTLATDQYLVGGASAVDVRLANGSTVSYGLGGTNGAVVGTSAAGAAVTLGQGSVVRDIIVRGAGSGIAANGVGGFALNRVTIENTGSAGLSLTNTLGNVALTGLTIRGGAGAGVLINGGVGVSLANSTISGGASAVDINDDGANLAVSLSNLTLSATGGNVLDVDGSGAGTITVTGMSGLTIRGGTGEAGGVSIRSATLDANTATTGIQTVNAGRMEVGTTGARVNGEGVFLTDVIGSLSFTDLDIANSGATGLHVVNSKVNSFTLATLDGTVDTVGGTAIDLDPLVINLNFTSASSVGAGGPGVILDTVQGGGTGGNALTIGTLTISNSGGDGLVVLNSTGLVRINGGTISGSGGSSVRIGAQGVAGSGGSANLIFGGSITDPGGASPIVAIFNAGGTISFTGPISGSGGILVEDTLVGSAINFGAITLTGTIGDAITLDGLAGSIRFNGLVTIANPGANGIVIGDVPGGVTFGDVDITGLGAFTGLDVRGAQGNVLFNTLDITGTGVGTGIDLTGSTNAGNVIILSGSVIEGVDIGVDLTQASMTGQFRFGDGDASVMNSRITANVPIVIELMNAGHGSYNFADVVLQGDTSNLTGAGFTAYYAQVGATGVGTRNDPGSLAGADASNAQFIVLLNDSTGGQDVFDAASAGGSFDLAVGQSLVSFLNGDFIAVSGASLPANLIVTGLGPSGITNVYAGSGGAVLTTSTAGSATVNLANNSAIDGLVIRNAGGDVGVEGSGVGNVRIVNSDISGANGAIAISDGGATGSVQLTNLDLASTAGTTLALSGAGAGTLTVSAANVDIAATGTSAALSLTDVTSGGISFGSVSTGTSATRAVSVENVTGGAVAFGSIAVAGTVAGEGVAIGGTSSTVTIGSVNVGGSDGNAVDLSSNSGAISIGSINATVNGTNGNGLFIAGAGDIAIGTLTTNGGDVGFAIDHSLGTITVGSGSISGADYGLAFDGVEAGSSVSIGALTVSGSAFDGIGLEGVDGSVAFTGTTSISGIGRVGILLGGGSTGTIAFGDVDITGLGANTTGVDATSASGTVSFNTLDITGSSTAGTRGIDLTGATFAGNLTTAESGTITGVGVGIDLTNAAITGSFRYGDGSNTDADGAASTINAVTPIVITGINAATGSYNFLDVVLTGDTSALTSSATLYFVKAGATGAGTMADPGSLAGAEASAANTIILLNDPTGGQDLLDAAGAGGSLDLAAGQTLLSFLGGDTLLLPGGAPGNILLFGVPQGQIGNPYAGSGAPILTTTVAGANTVVLGGGNAIDGVVIQTGAAGGHGVFGAGLANIAIRNSDISGFGGAIYLDDSGAAADVALSNLRLASSGGSVLSLNGTGAGTLTVTAFDNITIEGGNGETGGLLAGDVLFDADLTTAGAQTVIGSLTVGTAGARVDGRGVYIVGDGSLDLTSLTVFNANGAGVELVGNGALTAVVVGGSIDTLAEAALVAQNAALTLDFGSITATDGGIFMIANTAATAGQPVLNVGSLSLTDGGLILSGSGDYVFANAAITDTVGVAVLMGGAVNLDYAGDITSGTGAGATIVTLGHTGTASFHDGTIDVTDGDGFQFLDADGTYSFTGTATLHGGDAGINVANGSSGSFFFGAGTSVTDGAVANFVLQNSDANVTYLGSLSQSLNTDNFVISGQAGGTVDFSQATISASAGTGLLFIDADGDSMLGDVQLSGGAGIAIGAGSAGAISFDNVDITGLGANQTAVDLTGATGNVTFETLDITGTSTTGSKGIDLSGSSTAANIIINESSSITGVGIGVDLTNAAITGNFRFGDGSSVDADGAASLISASVPIEITGLNSGVGTYNFADVNLVGDTTKLVTSATTYFVKAGATGAGTMADPGSLSGAEASGAQIIVLLNDPTGGQDVLDAVDAGGSFDLFDGQSLLGFLNGDTLTLPAGGPTNLILFGLTPGQIVNPFASSGAPLLTNSGAGNTLELRSNTVVDGVLIGASNGLGILGLNAANVTIRNSVISGSQGAIRLTDGAANASAALRNLQLSAGSGAVLDFDGTNAGTLTITALDDITISGGNGETFGIRGNGVTFDADLVAGGIQTVAGSLQVGTTAARIGGPGISLENSDGAVDFAVDVATDGGSGIYVIGGAGGLRFGTSGGTIDAINAAGGFGLYLRDVSSAVTLDAISLAGGTGVETQNVTGVGAGGNALTVETLTVADGAAGGIVMTGSATGSFTFGQSSSIGNVTGSPIVLSNTGASAFIYNGDVNFSGASALLSVSGGHSGTVTFALGTLSATSGTGLVFDDADGTYNFSGTANLAAGIKIGNGSSGGFTFTNMTITNPAGSALDIQDSTASLSYSGDITFAAAVTPAIYIGNHSGGTITFGAGSLTTSGGNGITFSNADGTYGFTNTIDIDASLGGIAISGGSSGSFNFGPASSIVTTSGAALSVSGSSASVDYRGNIDATGGYGVVITDHVGGTIDLTGATMDLAGGAQLRFDNADASYEFGSFAGTGGSRIIFLSGSAGTFTFGDVDLAGIDINQTAVDLTGATGNVTFQTLDIAGSSTTGSKGIDLTGSTTAANIIINESSSITGVGIGVDLTNAAITGTFRYGDGSSTDADGAASSINAVTPIAIGGLNPGVGTYDFADVVLTGDTSSLQTNKTVFWVQAGATGIGTRSDPGALNVAEASGADVIILLDAQIGAGQDVIDAIIAGGGLDLAANQSLLSFLNGDTLSVGGGAPANLLLFGLAGGTVTNPYAGSGAPLLTTTQAGATTVNLASGALIDGVQIGNLDWKGVYGGYLTDVTVRNSVIFGGLNAIEIVGNGGSAALSNLDLSSATGDVLRLRGDGGNLVVTELTELTIRGGNIGRGLFGEQLFFDASAAGGIQTVVGTLDIGSSASRVGGAGLVLDDVTGALSLTTATVFNANGDGILAAGGVGGFTLAIANGAIDTTLAAAGSALNLSDLSADIQLANITYGGSDSGVIATNVTGIGTGGRALDVGTLTVASGAASGIFLGGTTSGTFNFGSGSSITGTMVAGIELSNTGAGAFTYAGGITGITSGATVFVHNGDVDTATFSGTLGATGGTGLQFDNADGTYTFTGTTTLNGGDAGIDILNGSAGAFSFGTGTSITSPSGIGINIANSTAGLTYSGNLTFATAGQAAVNILNHSGGTIRFDTGALNVSNGTGLQFDNADASYQFIGTTALNGGDAGIDVLNGSAGIFSFGTGTSITSPTGIAINVADSTAAFTYEGSLTYATAGQAAVRFVNHGPSIVIFQSAGFNITNGTGLQFDNADGSYSFIGAVTLNGGDAGIDIVNGSDGGFLFGPGISITSPSGIGINVDSSNAALIYLGGMTYATAGQAAVSIADHASGTIDFQSGTLNITNGTGLQFSNADGSYNFTGTATLNGGDAGIDVVNGSDGSFIFDVGTSITSPSGTGINVDSSNAAITYSGNLTYATAGQAAVSIADHAAGAITFQLGTLNITNGTGLQFDNADGTYNFTGTATLNGGDAGIDILNGSAGTFTFVNATSITSPSGTGINVQNSTASLTYSGSLTFATVGQAAVDIADHSGGTITFQVGTISATNGTGIRFDNADGTYNFNGTTTLNGGNAHLDIQNGSDGTFSFGTGASITSPSAAAAILINGADGDLTWLGSLTQAGPGALVAVTNHNGTLTFGTGALAATNGPGLQFASADGTYDFGAVTLSGGARIALAGSGDFTFGDVDITGLLANQTGVDLTSALGNVTFNTLDITGASATGTRGIDLTGNVGAGDVVVTNSSAISGVGIGVDLTNASRPGLFQYGDGESAIDVASTINATTPLVITGLNAGTGTYNFADVNLVGDTSALATSATVYYVLAGATGAGTLSDPGSLAGAELATADFIILLNNPTGGQDVLDALGSNGDDTLVLDVSQALRSFRDGNIILLPGGAPANVLLTGVMTGQVANPYGAPGDTANDRAPILTTTGAANTVTLANNSLVNGLFVQSASGFASIFGSGVSGVTLSNSTLFGAGGGLNLVDGGAAASATLTNLTISVTGASAALDLSGAGAGSLTVTGSGLNVSQGGSGGLVSINDVAIGAGGLAFGTAAATASGAGVDLVAVGGAGTLSFNNITIAGATGAGVLLSNSSAAVNLGNVTVSGATGAGVELLNSSAITLGTVNIGTSATGISATGLTGTLTVGDTVIDGATVAAILFGAGNTATIGFGNVDITGVPNGARGVDARLIGAGNVTFATLDITGASATGTRGIDLTGNPGTGDFVVANSSTIAGVGIGVDLTNASRTGLFQYGDGESAVDILSTINATTPLVITGLNGATGTYNFADVNLVGDTSALATSATVYYVLAGATGAGTLSDPGSLASAEAAAADFIILLNNPTGGQDVLDALGTNGDDTLVLDANQALRSFRDGNIILLPGGAPANVILTGVTTGQVTNPFAASAPNPTDRAPILTTTGAANTVTLANNSLVNGVFVQSVAGFAAIRGTGVNGITLSNATLSGLGTALRLTDGGAAATATLTNLSLSASGADAALDLSGAGAGSLTVAGSGIDVSHSGSGALLTIADVVVDAANLGFGTVSASAAGTGIDLGGVVGLGTLSFGSITVAGSSGSGVSLHNSSATVNLGDVTVSGAAGTGIALATNSGAITIGTVDISSSATGLSASGLTSTLTVGDGTIDGATVAGILIGAGNTVLLDFGNIDITALQAGARGVDARLTGGSNVFFDTLDISGASAAGTRGVDLTGNTASAAFVVDESSTITGVGIGVDLTNASRTGTFRYGDGSNIDADLAASTINATTPIVIAGLNGATGSYDFRDVTLVGDTSPLEVSAYFVRAGATGVGSRSDPGSLAGADASTASFIVLLDSQAGAGSFDTISGTLTLADNQSLLSFRDTDTFNVGGGAPPNVFVFNITTGTITNPNSGSGAPLLTSADANGTVQLGGTSVIDGVVVSNTGAGAGIYASGAAGTATIRNSTISGGGAGINLLSGAATLDVNLQNLALANAGNQAGALLNLNGTGGTLTVTGMSNLSINTAGGETAGLVFNTVTFDSDLGTAGIQAVNAGAFTIGTAGARVQGDGLSLTNVSGALTFADIDIANNGGTGLLVANSKVNNFLLTTLDGSVDTTNGTAINLDPLTVDIALASVTATGGAYGILLDQVEGSFNVNGAVSVAGATTAGIAIQDNTAQASPLAASFAGAVSVNNTTGAGLSLTNNAGATISFAGGGTGVDLVTTSGAGLIASGGGTISFAGAGNSVQTTTGQIVNIDGVTAGAGGMAFASLGNSNVVANTAVLINNLDGGAFSGGNVTIAGTSGATSDGIWIGGGSSSAISFGTATIGGTGDEGLEINGAGNGAISFLATNIDNSGGDGIRIVNSTGTVTISGGDIGNLNDPTGSGVVVDGGTGAITINAGILKTTAARAVEVSNRTGGSVDFGGFISSGGAASGWFLNSNSGGTITFSGAKTINTTGSIALELFNNAGATINFTNGGLAITSSQQGIQATGGGVLNITGAGNTISATGTSVVELSGMTVGANGINFASVSSTSIGNGIALTNVGSAGGAIALGTVNLQGVLTRGVDVTGTLGAALTITDLDIGLANAAAVAVDLNGATLSAAITANDFDVTNSVAAGTTIAVDLRGTLGGQIVRLGDATVGGASASIAGVGTGVWLNAATDATFTYGDGEAATDGTSTISAGTGINAAAAPVAGNYDFRDVTFGSSPGLGFGVGRTWFVDSNGAVGGGNGSGADGGNPMTLAAAELALAATDVIVLVNNGGAISTAGSNGNDTLALLADTQVRGFGQGPLALALTVPGTIQLSSNTINIADPTGNGAATLTSAAGASVITLGASGNRISGFILDGAPGGALRGIVDNGGATGTTINFMTIRNFGAGGGYGVEVTPSTNTVIDNVAFVGNTNDVLLNAAGSTISNVTATGATGTSITLDNATGTTTLTNVNISGAATGLSFTNGAGTINATNVDISGAATSAFTVTGGTASFNFDAASSIVQAAGGLTLNFTGNHTTGTFAFAGLINATSGNGIQFSNADGTYNFTGTTTLNGGNAGIDIYNGATGTFAFGSATNLTHNGAGNAFVLLSSANVTFDGTITDNDGVAVEIDGHDAGTATFNGAISSSIANASTVISVVNSNAGAVNFTGQMAIASTATVVNLSGNQGATITFNAGGTGLDITGTTSTAMIVTGGGTVNVQGANNSITTTSGTLLSITDTGGTATAVDLSFASASNTSGANGVFVQRVGVGTIAGTVNIGGGAITATTRGVSLNGDALTFSYGGTLTTSGAASRSFEATNRTGGTATLSGDLTDTSLGISIANNTGGTVNFTGQTISLNTTANTAVTLSNNSGATVNFASAGGGNGLDIVTTGGAGISATGGGTLTVTGAGNTIQTATGQILNFTGVSAGASGVTFASLQSTGTVAGIAINLNNFDSVGGGAFSGGTTSVAATSGGNDGIFIGNGSAANVSFGATTIGTGTISGDGIEVNGSGNGAVTFASVDIDNTAAHGVSVIGAAGATGAVSINGGTIGAGGAGSITGDGVNITGGGGSVTVAASIAKTNAGNVVEVTNHAAGTVTFSNNISATGGAANGILLSNNSGGTITFSGATKTLNTGANNAIQFDNTAGTGAAVSFTGGNLDVDTTTGRGITGTSTTAGAGSLTITGTNNTIASVGGIALNLVNTNIGAGGLNFLSIAANGGARGIVLNTTGGAGGLTVTGTGTTDGSGGTIQNITQRGIELLNTALVSIANLNLTNASTTGQAAGQDLDLTTANGAIYMSGVATAVFNNLNITGTIADNGITGINVSNFQLNNSLITGAGDGANESGIEFINLSGTSSLTNTEIALSETNSLDIVNTDVNLDLTLNNVIFRDTQSSGIGEGGLQFRSFSNAAGTPTTNIDVVDSDFLRIRTQGIQIIGEDDSVVSIDITNSVIDSQTGIGAGIDINGNDTSTVRFNIIGNPTIRSSGGAAVNITSFISANVMGRIANNADIEVYSQTPAGTGASGSGVRLLAQENSHLTVAVTGNTLTQGAGNNSSAVDVIAREGSARLDLTLTGNVIDSTDVNTLADINIQSGSSSGSNIETNQIYANIANNNLTATAAPNLLRLRVSELDNTHDPRIFLQGFVDGGAGIEDDAVATWNANGNTPGATTANIVVSLTGTATGPSAGTAQTPTNPLP